MSACVYEAVPSRGATVGHTSRAWIQYELPVTYRDQMSGNRYGKHKSDVFWVKKKTKNLLAL
jgi:hypothetical protein